MNLLTVFQENIRRLADIFPSCVKEQKDNDGKTIRKVDINTLQLLLGINQKESETCEFSWVGKREAVKEVYKPIRKTLRPVVQDSVEWDSTGNLYIEGDNLDVLKLLQESYLDSVKVIYIDPPYNTGNDFIYADDFRIRAREYVNAGGASQDDKNRMYQNLDYSGRYHSDWCSMIYARLLAARNLLCDDGVIFISIDDNEQANLKKKYVTRFSANEILSTALYGIALRQAVSGRNLRVRHMNIYCVMQKIKLVWICFLRRCQGKRSRCIGKKTSGDYTEIKILCLKINRQMQTKNTRSSVRTGRECVRKTDIFTGSCGKGLSRQRKKVL